VNHLTSTRGLLTLIPLAIAAVVLAVACSDGDEAGAPTAIPEVEAIIVSDDPTVVADDESDLPAEAMSILTAAGSAVDLRAEIAETPEERAQGLMGRTELAPDSGMLFVIEPPGRGFWMRGTTLALTVAFIGECGDIIDFADLEPLSEEIKNTHRPYAFALEMQRGWYTANGITAGDTLQLPRRLRPELC
jgi:uncharacterized membrane protein (UPF0127 family)